MEFGSSLFLEVGVLYGVYKLEIENEIKFIVLVQLVHTSDISLGAKNVLDLLFSLVYFSTHLSFRSSFCDK